MNFSVIIVAAGSGERAGPGAPKTWRPLRGKPVVQWSVETFERAGALEIVVVVAPDRVAMATDLFGQISRCRIVTGGDSRAISVQAGLAVLGDSSAELVMIHDGARPFVSTVHIQGVLAALRSADGAVPALPVADTLKRGSAVVTETVSRSGLWRAQTPQGFHLQPLLDAYAAWPADEDPTDDAAVMERAGGAVMLAPGDPMLMKLTYPEDFEMAERLASAGRQTRIGQGLDAHRWGPGDGVWLCGIRIPHSQSLVGHSDADAALHALTDALLGAIGDGDIGDHFPPSDPRWKGAPSDQFLTYAAERVFKRGGTISNIDLTLVCEQPKIAPHRQSMRERLASLLGLPLDRISVKATTMEGMGFTGRGEGLFAQAVVAIELPA